MYHQTLDTTGLICPMPVLKAKRQLQSMQAGEVLQVITTDKAALSDFPTFCAMARHSLIHVEQEAGKVVFYIKK